MKNFRILKTGFIFIFCLFQTQNLFAREKQKPNIVIIMTDQQFADAMSCVMGNKYLSTPNMDRLAEKGIRFTKAYSPNPLCMPMRTSMITGRFPHETGVLANNKKKLDTSKNIFLGKVFKNAGYETGYFGKWHISFPEAQKEIHGFEVMFPKSNLDAEPAVEFIKQKHEKPFLAFASFLSPHEICQWARKEKLPGGPIEELPALENLPPLKTNFGIPENETDIEAFMRKSYQANFRFPVGDYTEADWRRLIWGYYRLIERADAFVGKITRAIEESGQKENTLVVFLADHGDCAGSHHWNQKTVFYDESSRVPLIISWKGKTSGGTSEVLVNTGTDIIPTLCELAGIEIPSDLPGHSLKDPVFGITPNWKRDFVISENHMVQGDPVEEQAFQPEGRMVRSTKYKYCLYSEGIKRESLVDMQSDPQEMVNQAKNQKYIKILKQHRNYLKKHAEETNDIVALKMLTKVEK